MTTAPPTRPPGTSTESDALRALYADWSGIIADTPDLTTRLFRSIFDEWHRATREPEDVTYREDTLGGVPGTWTLPIGADPARVLLYTHGGGFAVGSAASHRKLAGHVAKALGATAFVADYRRAPEHPHPAQVQDTVAVFEALRARGTAPARSGTPRAATSPSPRCWPCVTRGGRCRGGSWRSRRGWTWRTPDPRCPPTPPPTPWSPCRCWRA